MLGEAIAAVRCRSTPAAALSVTVGEDGYELEVRDQVLGGLPSMNIAASLNDSIVGVYEVGLSGSEQDLSNIDDVLLYVTYRAGPST